MEPFDYPDNDPGPHTLTADGRPQNARPAALADEPLHGLCRRDELHGRASSPPSDAALDPVLQEISGRGLIFLDDGTSARSLVAEPRRHARGCPLAEADAVST